MAMPDLISMLSFNYSSLFVVCSDCLVIYLLVYLLVFVMLVVIDVHGSLSTGTRECAVFHRSLPTSICQSRRESASCKVLCLCVLFSMYVVRWITTFPLKLSFKLGFRPKFGLKPN